VYLLRRKSVELLSLFTSRVYKSHQRKCSNLGIMRGSTIWFALAVAWSLDALLAAFRHNLVQGVLTGFFACCFFAVGLYFRKRERSISSRKSRTATAPTNDVR
jgi:hypothetical protein